MNRLPRLSTLILFVLALLLGGVTTTRSASAATVQPAGPQTATLNQTGELETKLTDLTASLTELGRPLTILALVLALLSYVAEPALPDWARDNRGVIRRVLFAAIFIGLVPDIVGFFMT
jgi:hypothetical protein